MVRYKQLGLVAFGVVVLLITMIGALATTGSTVSLDKVAVDSEGMFFFDYKIDSLSNVAYFTCDFIVDNKKSFGNVITVPNKVNRISEDLDLAPGTYNFFIRCQADNEVVDSEVYSLKVSEPETEVPVPKDESRNAGLGDDASLKNIFFVVIVAVALFLFIKNLRPNGDKRKNKKFRRL